MATVQSSPLSALKPGPAWEIAQLLPDQGHFSESDYLCLTDRTNRMAELKDGNIEVLSPPTAEHQEILFFLITILKAFITPHKLGRAVMAGYRIKLGEDHFREPDVVFVRQSNVSRMANRFGNVADLVMEVVSEDEPKRDLVVKRRDYAKAKIAEYWIVDPRDKTVKVLRLEKGKYVIHSHAAASGQVKSALLSGFTADVAAIFAAAKHD